ncbi:MAG: phytanoyl-CoA dioxygenase family protein [Abitibacteriaceae bacterium]|nr:phytanoyl-CoA dioxygenase family protein [Abditibacteriaceae bacterium]
MLSPDQVAQFQADGYLKGNRVLNDEQVEVLREELARVIRDQDKADVPQPVRCSNLTGNPEQPVWQIVNIWEASEPYRKLISHPIITEEMAQLTGANTLRIWHDQIQYKPASMGGVNMWHQDAPLWPILAPMTEVSAWVALDDVDPENGCMSMVPGSHQWGNKIGFLNTLRSFDGLPPEYEGKTIDVRSCPVKKGEVHYHHALTWHGSPSNTSSRPRRAIALHYMTQETRFVASGQHIMKPFVEVSDGEVMQGRAFPTVWTK